MDIHGCSRLLCGSSGEKSSVKNSDIALHNAGVAWAMSLQVAAYHSNRALKIHNLGCYVDNARTIRCTGGLFAGHHPATLSGILRKLRIEAVGHRDRKFIKAPFEFLGLFSVLSNERETQELAETDGVVKTERQNQTPTKLRQGCCITLTHNPSSSRPPRPGILTHHGSAVPRMISVAELHARIEEISSAIICRRKVLSDLEKAKSDVESQLNTILDPITRLPLEISSEIFLLCLSDAFVRRMNIAPIVFLKVCRSWSNIALSTPSLWATIHVESQLDVSFQEHVGTWLSRSRSHPLSISLRGTLHPAVHKAMEENANRVQSLHVHILPKDLAKIKIFFPTLNTLTIGSTPDRETPAAKDCVAIMCAAPHLETCTLKWVITSGSTSPSRHVGIRHLRLGTWDQTRDPCTPNILRNLELPALETLSIPFFITEPDVLIDFLKRSSPPLQSFSFGETSTPWSTGHVETFCQLAPALTELWLKASDAERFPSVYPIIETLATYAHELLPHLRTLILSGEYMDRPHYEQLVRLLSARRGRLQIFHLKLIKDHNPRVTPPPAEIVASLQALVADGMEIH
ncbi:hypothetical protein C8R43DRAFT_1170405 [Mycena crocata]|nr:hypothetical protein C8R43DRAFT_1170405 [Mycena crocata]